MSHKVLTPKPEQLPLDGMSRFSQLKKFLPVSREKWRQLVRDGKAPRPIKLGIRCTMWRNADLHQFLADPVGYKSNG
ncbi:helix-turn-helix transcriptional regulator [Mesorhizobium japonicum]|uniref:helix-turn-helix transcriptional regulator n=1 Tax=Mesorhizobium japonicum TaxID=2066070 RepID=UPI003B5C4056